MNASYSKCMVLRCVFWGLFSTLRNTELLRSNTLQNKYNGIVTQVAVLKYENDFEVDNRFVTWEIWKLVKKLINRKWKLWKCAGKKWYINGNLKLKKPAQTKSG